MKKTIIIIMIVLAVFAGGAYLIYKQVAGSLAGVPAAGTSSTGSAVSALLGAAPLTAADNKEPVVKSNAAPEAIAEIAEYQYTEEYTNSDYGFSFKHPKDFVVNSVPTEEGEAILVQNIAKNIGVQILISPFDGGEIDMTVDFIKAEIPDLKIIEPREVLLGPDRKGLAFMSDNEAFGGAAREVWFVFDGRFYQISAYAELDGFLRGLFGTWKFN